MLERIDLTDPDRSVKCFIEVKVTIILTLDRVYSAECLLPVTIIKSFSDLVAHTMSYCDECPSNDTHLSIETCNKVAPGSKCAVQCDALNAKL